MLPLMVDVRNRQILIIGGGQIAFRRLSVLFKQGARIKVVSPNVIDEIKVLYHSKQIEWIQREVVKEDLADAFFIVAATDQKEVNKWVAKQAHLNQLVNIASEPELGNIQNPSFQQRGKLTLAVSTAGASPTLAKQLCRQLFNQFDEAFFLELEELWEERQKIKGSSLSQEEKKKRLSQLEEKYESKESVKSHKDLHSIFYYISTKHGKSPFKCLEWPYLWV